MLHLYGKAAGCSSLPALLQAMLFPVHKGLCDSLTLLKFFGSLTSLYFILQKNKQYSIWFKFTHFILCASRDGLQNRGHNVPIAGNIFWLASYHLMLDWFQFTHSSIVMVSFPGHLCTSTNWSTAVGWRRSHNNWTLYKWPLLLISLEMMGRRMGQPLILSLS